MTDRLPTGEKSLRRDLERLGIKPGMTLIVHSSLSSIGWVDGGPATVIRALLGAIGDKGTLAMPAATPQCAAVVRPDKSGVPQDRAEHFIPLFDRQTTPTQMGAVAERFRNWPGTLRSDHPLEAVCARGPLAPSITEEHPLAFSEGEGTPFDRLHDQDSHILLLGVGFNCCTALHFAESQVKNRRTTKVRFLSIKDNRRGCIEVPNVADDNDRHFPVIGERFLASGKVQQGVVGNADACWFRMRELATFARAYFDANL